MLLIKGASIKLLQLYYAKPKVLQVKVQHSLFPLLQFYLLSYFRFLIEPTTFKQVG